MIHLKMWYGNLGYNTSTLKLNEWEKCKKNYATKLFLFGNSGILKNFANFWPREAFSDKNYV